MNTEAIEGHIRKILELIEPETHTRQGLVDTPKRVAKAYREMFSGYGHDGSELLSKCFEDDVLSTYDGAVIVRKIAFYSQCEHHMAIFHGHAWIGYIPGVGATELTLEDGSTKLVPAGSGSWNHIIPSLLDDPTASLRVVSQRSLPGRVVGLSKLARLVEIYARRLQVQERLTQQIADDLEKYLQPLGVMIVMKAVHTCMCARGARALGTDTVTSTVRGAFRDKAEARDEFFHVMHLAE